MKKKVIAGVLVAVVAAAAYWYFSGGETAQAEIYVPVKTGKFTITVNSSGELYAKNSVDILGPSGINNVGIWQVKISNIIPEGTVVKEGEFVAALDGSELVSKMKDRQSELDKAQLQYAQVQIDTTLELRQTRDDLINQKYAQEEKKLVLQQSKYEPPATIRQAEIEFEKAKRTYQQSVENYTIKRNKSIAKMQEAATNVDKAKRALEFIQELLQKFTVNAPKGGMVIYAREWNGQKKREGSNISTWEPVVATLPDMSVMVSRTYVNEVDIQKIKTGQTVTIGLDAFPEKKFTGKVITVANVGEQKPNSDSKVFEVDIEVAERDTTILPAMTTSNLILAETIDKALSIPLEGVFTEGQMTYSFKKSGSGVIKQEIRLGKTNDNEAIVTEGLAETDQVLLTRPANADKLELVKLKNSNADKQPALSRK
jgi:hypothetical protein